MRSLAAGDRAVERRSASSMPSPDAGASILHHAQIAAGASGDRDGAHVYTAPLHVMVWDHAAVRHRCQRSPRSRGRCQRAPSMLCIRGCTSVGCYISHSPPTPCTSAAREQSACRRGYILGHTKQPEFQTPLLRKFNKGPAGILLLRCTGGRPRSGAPIEAWRPGPAPRRGSRRRCTRRSRTWPPPCLPRLRCCAPGCARQRHLDV